jgi:hypothetical protein
MKCELARQSKMLQPGSQGTANQTQLEFGQF